jgi:hypothetical protein
MCVFKGLDFLCFYDFFNVRFGGFCRYSRIEDLAFFKRPIKIEYINDSPRMVVVHDIIDKQLINHLGKEMSGHI